jgi:hypothetical protein
VISKRGVTTPLAVLIAGVLSCARSYPGPNTPSLIVRGAAIAAPGAAQNIAGCWRLQPIDWAATFLTDSLVLHLDTARVRGRAYDYAYAARLITPPLTHETLRVRWAAFGPGDSLYITIYTSSRGVELRLGRAADSLTGVGRNWDDTFSNTQTGSIVGRRTSCFTQPLRN